MHRHEIEGILEIERVRHRSIGESRHRQTHLLSEAEECGALGTALGSRQLDEGQYVAARAARRQHHPETIEDRPFARGDRGRRQAPELRARHMRRNSGAQSRLSVLGIHRVPLAHASVYMLR